MKSLYTSLLSVTMVMQAFSFTIHTSYDANSDYALGDIVPSSDAGTLFYQANFALIGGSHSLSNSIQWTAVSSDSIPSYGSDESNSTEHEILLDKQSRTHPLLRLLQENSTLTEEKASLQTQLATANADVSTLTAQLSDTQASLQSVLASNSTLNSEKASLEAQLQTANSRISELETELVTIKSQQSSNSNYSNTTSGSTSQSSSSSSTEVAVKNVASIKAYGLHAFLDVGSSSGGGSLYFTTYDGRSTWPLNDSNRISGELKQSSFGSSNFVTDYLAGNYYGVYEHGTVTLSMPTSDSDSNGVPDWLQKNMSVNSNISGSSKLHYLSSGAVSGDSTIRGTISRSAGLSSGNYSLTYTISGYGSSTASGVWYIGYYDGTIEYDGTTYSISARTLNPDGNTVTATGSSEFSISDENTLNIGVINLDVDGDTIQLQAGSLNRSGSKYAGFAKAIDGNANTSWADYIDWYIEISDPNDSDNDNIPDFTDPVEARSLSTSLDLSGWSWHSWPWVYNNSLKSWLFYPSSAVWSYKHQKWFFWDDSSESWVDSY